MLRIDEEAASLKLLKNYSQLKRNIISTYSLHSRFVPFNFIKFITSFNPKTYFFKFSSLFPRSLINLISHPQ